MSQYATLEELAELGTLPEATLAQFDPSEQTNALIHASGYANDYIAGQFTPPLDEENAPQGLKEAVCAIASFKLLRKKGFDPEQGANMLVVKANDDAVKWLLQVQSGRVRPFGALDATPDVIESDPIILTQPARGW